MKAPSYKIRALSITETEAKETEAKETEWVTSKDDFARAWYNKVCKYYVNKKIIGCVELLKVNYSSNGIKDLTRVERFEQK